MINSREHLIHVLSEAAELEHNLLCSYLYAVFSLKRQGEPGLSQAQGEAVERWRKVILSVALEEMAHLACVNNLLIAVGGSPHFDRPNLPISPGYHPAGIVVRLTPFEPATLDHFIFLEQPDSLRLPDAPGFEPAGAERVAPVPRLTPSALDYRTVGELYDSVGEGFRTLAERLSEAVLIDPEGAGQLDSAIVKLADVPRITSLGEALASLDQIKEQGEGSSGGEDSHFERFKRVKQEWAELSAQDPDFAPAWPAAHDPVMRKPEDTTTRVWITDPQAAACLDLGNAIYGAMLTLLGQAFAGLPHAQANMEAAVEMMEGCAAVGSALARLPAGPDYPGVNAGLSFAVPRNLGARLGGAPRLAVERIEELLAGAEQVLDGVALEKAVRRLTGARDRLLQSV